MAVNPSEEEAFKQALEAALAEAAGATATHKKLPDRFGELPDSTFSRGKDGKLKLSPYKGGKNQPNNPFDIAAHARNLGEGIKRQAEGQAAQHINKLVEKGEGTVDEKGVYHPKGSGQGKSVKGMLSGGGGDSGTASDAQAQADEMEEAKAEIYGWSDNELNSFRNQLTLAGYKGDEMTRGDLVSAWAGLVQMSVEYRRKGKSVTPFDILSTEVPMAQSRKKEAEQREFAQNIQGDFYINPDTGEKTYLGPRQVTQVNRDVNYTDPNTARALVDKTMQNFLGRDPTNAEANAYISALNAAQKANPVTTSRVQHFSEAGDLEGTDTYTVGGVDEESLAIKAAKETEEYASVQAATTYMSALRSMVYGSY